MCHSFCLQVFQRKVSCLFCLFILVPSPPPPHHFSFVCLQKTMLCPCTQTHASQHMNMQVYMHTQICTPITKYMKSKMWKQQCICIFFKVSRSAFAETFGDSSFAESYAQGVLYAMVWLYLWTLSFRSLYLNNALYSFVPSIFLWGVYLNKTHPSSTVYVFSFTGSLHNEFLW